MKKALVRKLDTTFSKYIRLRDTKDGYGKCCSCGNLKTYAELDCGHFINRKWLATRWNEENCHVQCISCNRFDEGNGAGYTLYMVDTFGRERVDYLRALSRETQKFTDSEGELLISHYKAEIKKLEKQ